MNLLVERLGEAMRLLRRVMRRSVALSVVLILGAAVALAQAETRSVAAAQTIYQIDLRGHMSLLANDRPIQRGHLALFHRYPDGVFLSIPEEEIVRVGTVSARPTRRTLLPGDAIDVGPTGGSYRPEVSTPEGSAATAQANASSDGLMNSGYYGYGGSPAHGKGPQLSTFAAAPPVIGPNGLPTMTNPSAVRGSK